LRLPSNLCRAFDADFLKSVLAIVDRSEVRTGDKLLLLDSDESEVAELELRVQTHADEWVGRLRDRPDIAVGSRRARVGLRELHAA
jgi:hypothetical protein